MPPVIYFRLGQHEKITLGSLVRSLSNVKGLLYDFDAAISRDPRGLVRWEVAVLEKNSPAVIGVFGEAIQRRNMPPPPDDFPERVQTAFLESTARLSFEAKRTNLVSDSALQRFQVLANQSKRMGEIAVYTTDEQTLENISRLTQPKTKSVGSVLGKLDTISVHHANEIRVWDENTNRPVRCRYPNELEETVKSSLRERVLVSGVVSYNAFGQATAVDVATLVPYGRNEDLPTIEQMVGLIDDVTGGVGLKKYLEHLRDG
jgi:hypothetical protein